MQDRRATVVFDERMLLHRPTLQDSFAPGRLERRVRHMLDGLPVKWAFPDRPERLVSIRDLLDARPVPGVSRIEARPATREQLLRVHPSAYVDGILELRGRSAWLDIDTTALSAGSVEAAEVAAGAAIAAVEEVAAGNAGSAFALVRPPGHHADSVRARGFCLFNNVTVAAAHAQAALGFERVLILDWDAHHGNGAQENFWAEISAIGDDEAFIRLSVAHEIDARMRLAGETLAEAADHVVMRDLPAIKGSGGLVAADAAGRGGAPFNCEGMYRGWAGDAICRTTAIY